MAVDNYTDYNKPNSTTKFLNWEVNLICKSKKRFIDQIDYFRIEYRSGVKHFINIRTNEEVGRVDNIHRMFLPLWLQVGDVVHDRRTNSRFRVKSFSYTRSETYVVRLADYIGTERAVVLKNIEDNYSLIEETWYGTDR